MIDKNAKDSFASIATGLINAGIPSVVAMGYTLWVSGANEFVPEFYRQLFSKGDIAKAIISGRQQMYDNRERDSIDGKTTFHDWVVPVLYQHKQAIDNVNILPKLNPNADKVSSLPNEVLELSGFDIIWREQDILRLERAILASPAGILIHGMFGVGKTTLVKVFLQWLEATNGLGKGAFWFDFTHFNNATDVIATSRR